MLSQTLAPYILHQASTWILDHLLNYFLYWSISIWLNRNLVICRILCIQCETSWSIQNLTLYIVLVAIWCRTGHFDNQQSFKEIIPMNAEKRSSWIIDTSPYNHIRNRHCAPCAYFSRNTVNIELQEYQLSVHKRVPLLKYVEKIYDILSNSFRAF